MGLDQIFKVELRSSCFAVQPKSLEHYLSQEEPRLLNHLKISDALSRLPYGLWFRRCFAGCLPESSLQRSVYLVTMSAPFDQTDLQEDEILKISPRCCECEAFAFPFLCVDEDFCLTKQNVFTMTTDLS